jgi:hypothetical protein
VIRNRTVPYRYFIFWITILTEIPIFGSKA